MRTRTALVLLFQKVLGESLVTSPRGGGGLLIGWPRPHPTLVEVRGGAAEGVVLPLKHGGQVDH